MTSNLRCLNEIVAFRGGGTPRKDVPEYWAVEIPWASVKDFKSLELTATQDFISRKGLESSASNLIPAGHVIIPTRMALGKAAINSIDLAINQDLRALIPKVPLDSRYLLHAMIGLAPEIETQGSGATVKGITQDKLGKLQIPLPPLAEQKRIAGILDAADALRAKRRESLDQLDSLLQSTFLTLFGDPVSNPMGWEVSRLGDVFDLKHGFAFKSEDFVEHGRYVLLTPGNFYEKGGFRDRGERQRYHKDPVPEDYVLQKNDLLVAMTEQAPGLLGSPILVPESGRFLHNQRLGKLVKRADVESLYVFELLNNCSIRARIQKDSTGTKVKHTSPSKIAQIEVGIPPLPLQRRFAAIVESVERQKAGQRAHLAELDALFASLQHRAFRGEL